LQETDPVNDKPYILTGREVKGLRGAKFGDYGIFAYTYNRGGMFID
jgi:hypothetical protein